MYKNILIIFCENFCFEKQDYLKICHKDMLQFLAWRGLHWSRLMGWLFVELGEAIVTHFLWDTPVRNAEVTARENDCTALCETGQLEKWRQFITPTLNTHLGLEPYLISHQLALPSIPQAAAERFPGSSVPAPASFRVTHLIPQPVSSTPKYLLFPLSAVS